MGLLAKIIADAKALEAESVRDEEDSQKAYEGFVTDSNNAIKTKTDSITDKKDTKAQKEAELTEERIPARDGLVHELEELANYKTQLHQDCDFTLDNFDLRQKHRDEEILALKQAKAVLSGSDFKLEE